MTQEQLAALSDDALTARFGEASWRLLVATTDEQMYKGELIRRENAKREAAAAEEAEQAAAHKSPFIGGGTE